MTFVDTSGIIAYFDARDRNHRAAMRWLHDALDRRERLVSHSHVLVETMAVLQQRFGIAAVRDFAAEVAPAFDTVWVDEDLHRRGLAALLGSDRGRVSFVDCITFELMRSQGIGEAFAFDRDFEAHGFATVP